MKKSTSADKIIVSSSGIRAGFQLSSNYYYYEVKIKKSNCILQLSNEQPTFFLE